MDKDIKALSADDFDESDPNTKSKDAATDDSVPCNSVNPEERKAVTTGYLNAKVFGSDAINLTSGKETKYPIDNPIPYTALNLREKTLEKEITHQPDNHVKTRAKTSALLEESSGNDTKDRGTETPLQMSTIKADKDPQWSGTHHSQIKLQQLQTSTGKRNLKTPISLQKVADDLGQHNHLAPQNRYV